MLPAHFSLHANAPCIDSSDKKKMLRKKPVPNDPHTLQVGHMLPIASQDHP